MMIMIISSHHPIQQHTSAGERSMMFPLLAKCAVVVLSALARGASAFSVSPGSAAGTRQSSPRLAALAATSQPQQQQQPVLHMTATGGAGGAERGALPTSRRDVIGAVFGVAASSFAFVAAADAKDDPALKGTKADPEFVTCLSECIYYCTKSKEQARSRQECIPECRKSCAKTKAQGMVGSPRD